jgi:5-methyltetrahydrofolate--homocysteine methyltransferase
MIGLSGLITPSLDEMVSVAKEMQRRGLELPLLIGGATTSKQHTAVKISPEYAASTVHVADASRAVGVVASLLDPRLQPAFDAANRELHDELRAVHSAKLKRPLLSLAEAQANRLRIEWRGEDVPEPAFLGRRAVDDVSLGALVDYIDWTFFFTAWELKGKFPKILEHPKWGAAARDLYAQGQKLLRRIIDEKLLTPRGVYGFWPAVSKGDDVAVYRDEEHQQELARFCMLRQQSPNPRGQPNRSLADFIAPAEAGMRDHVGAFAVTAGIGADELVAEYERALDDYSAIMVKALADRLVEAFAEYLHERARREWGYGAEESLSNEDRISEKYRGIRPAFGYPACPNHPEKRTLFALLDAPAAGIELTESYAMAPAASVSGLYFAHPQAQYFTVGRIGRDQVESYANRTGMTLREAERWLAPNLGYEPEA